ncbi:hypothetical protein [Acinetobacter sp. WCHAc060007]|uniref:hypothetical protein n=1 Tax=Acinetobacter sp. WCHAc060007 TaxID=2419605 RepID=UPI000EA1B799|nr:hypothetical protein [Acinetobacter sp. WCHAc060007]RKG37875.1 hypothetical protein D7V31_15990 [Acinetobacter sp. WCHAc060007]
MWKTLLATCLLIVSPIAFAKKNKVSDYIEIINQNTEKDCKINSFNLLNLDPVYADKFKMTLNNFGSLKINDFDRAGCITSLNTQKNILTSALYQIDKTTMGHRFKAFSAYDLSTKELLLVIIDGNNKSYLVGDKKDLLKKVLSESFSANEDFQVTQLSSVLTFSDLAKSKDEINKEADELKIIQDLKNQEISLINKAESSIKNSGTKNLIKTDTSFDSLVLDGNGKKVKANVGVRLDSKIPVPLSKSDLEQNIYFVSEMIKIKLKNPYSYRPRDILAKQDGTKLEIIIRYTAQNSYGADVVGIDAHSVYLWGDGKYHAKPAY